MPAACVQEGDKMCDEFLHTVYVQHTSVLFGYESLIRSTTELGHKM